MRYLAKIANILGWLLIILSIISFTVYSIISSNPKWTLAGLATMLILAGMEGVAYWVSKRNVNLSADFEYIKDVLRIYYLFPLLIALPAVYQDSFFDIGLYFPLFIIGIFSYHTYICLLKDNVNAIFMIRCFFGSLIIFWVILFVYSINNHSKIESIEHLYQYGLITIALSVIPAVCIKGLLNTFGENAKTLFPVENRRIRFIDIFIVLLYIVLLIIMFNTDINIPNNFYNFFNQEYPPLNIQP